MAVQRWFGTYNRPPGLGCADGLSLLLIKDLRSTVMRTRPLKKTAHRESGYLEGRFGVLAFCLAAPSPGKAKVDIAPFFGKSPCISISDMIY